MKKHFLTGLAIVLPIIVTFFLILFIVNFLTAPFLAHSFISKTIVLVVLFFAIAALGYSAEYFFIHSLIKWGEKLIFKIPLIGKVYQSVQDILHTFFGNPEQFSKTALAEFPNEKSTTLGFITNDHLIIQGKEEMGPFSAFYVPGNPNPMMGFLILVPKEKLKRADLVMREASRFIFSCGILKPENPFPKESSPL